MKKTTYFIWMLAFCVISTSTIASQFYTIQAMAARMYFMSREASAQIQVEASLSKEDKSLLLPTAIALMNSAQHFERETLDLWFDNRPLTFKFAEVESQFNELQMTIGKMGLVSPSLSDRLEEMTILVEQIKQALCLNI